MTGEKAKGLAALVIKDYALVSQDRLKCGSIGPLALVENEYNAKNLRYSCMHERKQVQPDEEWKATRKPTS